MTKAMSREIAERLASKQRMYECFKDCKEFENNQRFNPFYSEFHGMVEMLKVMGIEYDFEYNENYEMVTVTVNGETARI